MPWPCVKWGLMVRYRDRDNVRGDREAGTMPSCGIALIYDSYICMILLLKKLYCQYLHCIQVLGLWLQDGAGIVGVQRW